METDRKVVVIGAGTVGSTFAYTLMRSGLASEIVLIDKNTDKARGEAMDMNHGLFFTPPVTIRAGDYEDCRDAAVIVFTAGPSIQPGQTRLDLVHTNVGLTRDIMDEITRRTRSAIIIMVSNPVDVLTYVALKHSGLPRNQVIGSGTVLDSARLRFLLSQYYRVDPRNVHAHIVGEHGDSEVALWSKAHIGGIPMEQYCVDCHGRFDLLDHEKLLDQVRHSGYHVLEAKGATYYAVSLSLEKIVSAILRNENSILTVSTYIEDFYGEGEVCMSLPALVNRRGADYPIWPVFNEDELQRLKQSARTIRETIALIE